MPPFLYFGKENVTVAAEICSHSKQVLREMADLKALGKISSNKSLYEGVRAEKHKLRL